MKKVKVVSLLFTIIAGISYFVYDHQLLSYGVVITLLVMEEFTNLNKD
jgi:hypothetical protein